MRAWSQVNHIQLPLAARASVAVGDDEALGPVIGSRAFYRCHIDSGLQLPPQCGPGWEKIIHGEDCAERALDQAEEPVQRGAKPPDQAIHVLQ